MDIPLQPASLSSANLIIFHHLGLSHTQSGINLLSFSLPTILHSSLFCVYISVILEMKSYRCPIKNCIIACWLRMSRDRCFNVWHWRELNLMKFSGDKYKNAVRSSKIRQSQVKLKSPFPSLPYQQNLHDFNVCT